MKVYKSFAKYCIYKGEEYICSERSGKIRISTDKKEKLDDGFEEVDSYSGTYYRKMIDKSEVDDFYQLGTSIVYKGFLVPGSLTGIRVEGSSDGRDPVANRLGLEMHDRGEYSKNITEDEIDYIAISRYYMEELKGFKFNIDDVNNRFKIINFVQKGKYKWNEYNVSIRGNKIKLSTQDKNLIDETFKEHIFNKTIWYRKEIRLGELSQHYGIKCFGIYKGVKCEVYSVIPGIMLTVAPDTEEEKQNLLDLGFYISNTDLNYCEKIVKPEEVELIYERIEMGIF